MILTCSDPSDCWAHSEFVGAHVWDLRCLKSLSRIADALSRNSEYSFSRSCGPILRQCAHRIFEHKTTTVNGLLAGHIAQTRIRANSSDAGETERENRYGINHSAEGEASSQKPLILVVQDTTDFEYSKHFATKGLGPIGHLAKRGLVAHSGLAVTPQGVPLGIVHLDIWARLDAEHGKKKARATTPIEEKESFKWIKGLHGIEAAFEEDQPLLVIGDRESDVYELLAEKRRPSTHLLVRASHARRVTVEDKKTTLIAAVGAADVAGTYTIRLPRRPGVAGSVGEKERDATLQVRFCELTLPASTTARRNTDETKSVCVRVVQVSEQSGERVNSSSADDKRVDWVLITTLPIDNFESARQLVEYYTRRWLIERLHYTLKSGLRAEGLQFDDATSLKHALTLLYVVAWRLLWLLHIARSAPEAPAAQILEPMELTVLQALSRRAITTAQEAHLEIAKLGGYEYYPSAAPPGIKSLWLGRRRLDDIIVGFQLSQPKLN